MSTLSIILLFLLIFAIVVIIFLMKIGMRGGRRYRLLSVEIIKFNDFLSTDEGIAHHIADNLVNNDIVEKLIENFNIMLKSLNDIDKKI